MISLHLKQEQCNKIFLGYFRPWRFHETGLCIANCMKYFSTENCFKKAAIHCSKQPEPWKQFHEILWSKISLSFAVTNFPRKGCVFTGIRMGILFLKARMKFYERLGFEPFFNQFCRIMVCFVLCRYFCQGVGFHFKAMLFSWQIRGLSCRLFITWTISCWIFSELDKNLVLRV